MAALTAALQCSLYGLFQSRVYLYLYTALVYSNYHTFVRQTVAAFVILVRTLMIRSQKNIMYSHGLIRIRLCAKLVLALLCGRGMFVSMIHAAYATRAVTQFT